MPRRLDWLTRYIAAAARLAAAWLIVAGGLAQEVKVVSAEPGDGAVLDQSPERIVVRFNSALEPSRSRFSLVGDNGPIVAASTGVDRTDPQRASLNARFDGLADGQYTLKWQVVPIGSETATSGAIEFRVDTAAALKRAMPEPDPRRSKFSERGLYRVRIRPIPEVPAVNQLHSWQIQIESPGGGPVCNANLKVSGGMALHAHGLPTTPRVSEKSSEPGLYLVEGVKFHMGGNWQFTVAISSPQGEDRVSFDVVL